MTTGPFDPAAFEASAATENASSTAIIPHPEGEYNGIIEDYKFRTWESKAKGTSGVTCDITFKTIDDTGEITAKLGRHPMVTHGYFVEANPAGGFDFSEGKNVWLGRIREAVGQNVPGQRWAFPMLKGQPIKYVVFHEPSSRPGDDQIFARVRSVGKVG